MPSAINFNTAAIYRGDHTLNFSIVAYVSTVPPKHTKSSGTVILNGRAAGQTQGDSQYFHCFKKFPPSLGDAAKGALSWIFSSLEHTTSTMTAADESNLLVLSWPSIRIKKSKTTSKFYLFVEDKLAEYVIADNIYEAVKQFSSSTSWASPPWNISLESLCSSNEI